MHNIDMTNGRANIAFLGSRNDVWHRMGQEMQVGMSVEAWAQAAGLEWQAVKVPAIANLAGATVREGTAPDTAWAALNAITRYIDHDRSTRGNGVSAEEKQFTSAQFGSGAQMKAQAWELLLPRIKDKVLIDA